ncbi:hypothetical protein AAT19DRAFT_8491 [Rhodotorula toruloides]|uniref:Uncharacterized protein n=1 Tax=Rhodotorula toruloides TaxID=5286 RepID=A0A2T0AHE0_RHOTO|nr:hypothetical protein AAT19DRAFT_8491 [Rhodotorula toruloides]
MATSSRVVRKTSPAVVQTSSAGPETPKEEEERTSNSKRQEGRQARDRLSGVRAGESSGETERAGEKERRAASAGASKNARPSNVATVRHSPASRRRCSTSLARSPHPFAGLVDGARVLKQRCQTCTSSPSLLRQLVDVALDDPARRARVRTRSRLLAKSLAQGASAMR